MLTAAKWVLAIVPSGIALGALLGAAANPDMKDAPPPFWRLTGQDQFVAAGGQTYIPAGPDDLSPYGGYRPDLDYDSEVWGSRIAYYEVVGLLEESLAPLPEEELPTVTYGVTSTEVVADEVEAAAEDATAAVALEPAPESPDPGEVRKPELVSAGLY